MTPPSHHFIDRDGYQVSYAPGHLWPRKSGYLPEHVRIWELHHGRRVPRGHVVHHRNGRKRDNRLANLELMEWGAHSRAHAAEKVRGPRGRFVAAASARRAA